MDTVLKIQEVAKNFLNYAEVMDGDLDLIISAEEDLLKGEVISHNEIFKDKL